MKLTAHLVIPALVNLLILSAVAVLASPPVTAQADSPVTGTDPPGDGPAAKETGYWSADTPVIPDAVLWLGCASEDRVRELQKSLKRELANKDIRLPRGPEDCYSKVGPPRGPSSDPHKQIREVQLAGCREKFYVHGDWTPYLLGDNGEKIAVTFAPAEQLKNADCLHIPGDGASPAEDAASVWTILRRSKAFERPIRVDGVYGRLTYAAVKLFQLQQALPATGEVDVVTLDKLEPMVPSNRLLEAAMTWVIRHAAGNESDPRYPRRVKTRAAVAMALLILVASTVAFGLAFMLAQSPKIISRWLYTHASSAWFSALVESHVFTRLAHLAPALFIYCAVHAIYPAPNAAADEFPYLNTFQDWHVYLTRFALAYMSLVFVLVGLAAANACQKLLTPDDDNSNPVVGIIRASKRIIGLVGVVLVCWALAGRNPFVFIGGLGAFMAVIMLVFRDYLLGLVASIQIITHNILRIGDWITMPKYSADGHVTGMSLTLVTVQNFDKTISTIPIQAILSEPIVNRRGMQEAGGRRILRSILIDLESVQVCTPEMLKRLGQIELLRDYMERKQAEIEAYNGEHDAEASRVNCRQLTNIGTFRAYVEAYLRNHPAVNHDLTLVVRHQEPTAYGLPVELYAFTKETGLKAYEAAQADIFDHVLTILPEFGLRAFQGWNAPLSRTD